MTNQHWHRLRGGFAALAGIVLVAGCSPVQMSPRADTDFTLFRIERPVSEPVWSAEHDALFGLIEKEARVAKITPHGTEGRATASTMLSPVLAETGRNIAISPAEDDVAYLPQPKVGRVVAIDTAQLDPRGTLGSGPSPSYVAADEGSETLLTLSEDGSTVTGVDLQRPRSVTHNRVAAGADSELDGPARGRLISYHVTGPEGVSHFKGVPPRVSMKGHLDIPVEDSAGDRIKVSRNYLAEEGTDRVIAVDSRRDQHGMDVVAQIRLGETVRHIWTDDARIYAATAHQLVVLETNSFEGYENNTFTVVDTIDFRSVLPSEALKKAPLSGLAVGSESVYLTFEEEPYMVGVAKPAM